MKILFVGYYELSEHLKCIKKIFKEYNYIVDEYPLFKYAHDSIHKVEKYQDHFQQFIEQNNINIILWWFLGVPHTIFQIIKKQNPNVYFILVNNEDPLNLHSILPVCNIFDLISSPSINSIPLYKNANSTSTVIWNPPGYDPIYFHNKLVKLVGTNYSKFECDISIICYDLYSSDIYVQEIPRQKLLVSIIEWAKNNNKTFKIFGPFALRELFPLNYVSDILYAEQYILFNCSKINIVSHPFNNCGLTVSEIEFKILGSGGLLYTDQTFADIFIDNHNIVAYNQENYLGKIKDILDNYDKYTLIKKNGKKIAKKYSWENFVKKLHFEICKHFFDDKYYKKIYQILNLSSKHDLWNYWMRPSSDQKEICFRLVSPQDFDHNKYYTCNKKYIPYFDKDVIYHHWYINGRKKKYILNKDENINTLVSYKQQILKLNTTYDQVSIINNIFNQIYLGKNEFFKLCQLAKYNPGVKMNIILELYIDIVN